MRAAHTGLSTKHLWERKGDLRKAWRLLYVVMRALRKLSRISRWMLYRGMGEPVSRSIYVECRFAVWHVLSSMSPDMKAVKEFLTTKALSAGSKRKPSGDTVHH